MTNVFASQQFSDRDPANNMRQMNAIFMDLMNSGAVADREDFGLKNLFGDLYIKARFSIENTFDKFLKDNYVELRPSVRFERYVQTMPYTDMMSMRAEIPEGLDVTFMEYMAVMLPAQERANAVLLTVITPFELFVSRMISDDTFRNQMGHQVKEFKDLESDYDKTVKAMGKCFKKNGFNASAPFSDVVKRNGDWKVIFKHAGELKGLIEDFPKDEITKRLNRLYDQLDELVAQVRADKFSQVEKETTHILSEGMYHVAKEIELAALTTYRSKNFIHALNTTLQNVEAVEDRAKND